ncbi:hypothetical protein EW146_g8194 [Bondarzewia mesenterica]|uniref:Uncharacterized protein n=1 Tax=Bondarzewia mesenterica TaxID=1095465 RepID=A0A4S4LI82_9AGAM|nr:hypothetical protein EW146_g8194 [Bondarzewia mesenterica]
MRPSLPRLLRIVPRSAVIGPEAASQPRAKIFEEIRKENRTTPTLLEVLQQRKAEAGANYPLNIRIEPPISKQTFAGLSSEIRASLEAALRER